MRVPSRGSSLLRSAIITGRDGNNRAPAAPASARRPSSNMNSARYAPVTNRTWLGTTRTVALVPSTSRCHLPSAWLQVEPRAELVPAARFFGVAFLPPFLAFGEFVDSILRIAEEFAGQPAFVSQFHDVPPAGSPAKGAPWTSVYMKSPRYRIEGEAERRPHRSRPDRNRGEPDALIDGFSHPLPHHGAIGPYDRHTPPMYIPQGP